MKARPSLTLILWSLLRLAACNPGIPLPAGSVIVIASSAEGRKDKHYQNEY